MNSLPDKKYNVIYADPPWKYNARNNKNTKFGGGAGGHYKLLTMEQLKALPVSMLADENCALFMWCTFPYLDKQIQLFKEWGFIYKTVGFVWIKTNPGRFKLPLKTLIGKLSELGIVEFIRWLVFFGIGYYTKSNAEVCLLGIKGKIKPVSNKVSSIVISPKQEHSRKPEVVRNRIKELIGEGNYIELFARERSEGWDAWGNEI